MTRTPRFLSTSSIQRASSAEHARIALSLPGRQQPLAHLDRLGQVDREPADAAVVDAPELRLESLAECDDRPVGMLREEALDLAVERERAQRLPLRQARLCGAEALAEREVDRVEQLDGLGSCSTASLRRASLAR